MEILTHFATAFALFQSKTAYLGEQDLIFFPSEFDWLMKSGHVFDNLLFKNISYPAHGYHSDVVKIQRPHIY